MIRKERNLIVGRNLKKNLPVKIVKSVSVDGVDFDLAIHETQIPYFDNTSMAEFVLVKKLRFSCNFRDKEIILGIMRSAKKDDFIATYFGSDFIASVIQIGVRVPGISIGNKVIGNASYGEEKYLFRPGIPSNCASKEYEIIHYSKILVVPDQMDLDTGGAFTVGAQTSYSMIRRAKLQPGARILISSLSSNTGLFLYNALKNQDYQIIGLARTQEALINLGKIGVKNALEYNQVFNKEKSYDCIFDFFADTNLGQLIDVLDMNGKYLFCGNSHQLDPYLTTLPINFMLQTMIVHNITVIGNCLGTTEDLQNAIRDNVNGIFEVIISHSGTDFYDFFVRSFINKNGLGKTVYRFE